MRKSLRDQVRQLRELVRAWRRARGGRWDRKVDELNGDSRFARMREAVSVGHAK